MDIEKIGEIYNYNFNYAEFVVTCGLLKYLDEKRRQGGSDDTILLHSAIRPIYSEEAPDDDTEGAVRWVYDSEKTQVGNYRQAAASPPLPALLALTEDVLASYETRSAQHLLQFPIGYLVLERPVDRPACSRTTYQSETLSQLKGNVSQYHLVLSGWQNHLSNN